MDDAKAVLDLAVEAARAAGKVLLRHLGGPLELGCKSSRADLVTQADRESEAVLRQRLLAGRPGSGFFGEETGATAGMSGERWIVDPLDGTTNFVHAFPFFCVSIAFERDGVVEAGVIYNPAQEELFAARRGAGAERNGTPLHVSEVEALSEALLCTGFMPGPGGAARNLPHFVAFSDSSHAVRRVGAAALDLCYVAMGAFDGFWEHGLHPWDVAAGSLIVSEAGGRVTKDDGSAFTLDGREIVASNGRIHEEMLSVLAAV
ncbi:MAG: inositol monophosphatase [bacterium]|nr:inositol monophosphatase [bacterium]